MVMRITEVDKVAAKSCRYHGLEPWLSIGMYVPNVYLRGTSMYGPNVYLRGTSMYGSIVYLRGTSMCGSNEYNGLFRVMNILGNGVNVVSMKLPLALPYLMFQVPKG